MRGIVFSLLLANLGVFAYFQFFAPVVASTPQVQAPPVGNHQSLAILSEQQLAERGLRVASLPPKPDTPPVCTLVGPFEKLLNAEYFVERLSALSVLSEIKRLTVAGDKGFWLHLSPLVSRKEALSLLRELQQKQVDSYIIPSGELANGISLGMFSDRSRAQDMEASIKRLGYNPEIAEVSRDQQEIWLYLPQGEAAKLAENRWLELLSAEESLQKRQNLCSDVASLSNFQ